MENWVDFLKFYEVEGLTIFKVENQEEYFYNIILKSVDCDFELTIDTNKDFKYLYDLRLNYNFKGHELGFSKHFEGLEFSLIDSKILVEYLRPFLFDGWYLKEFIFLKTYRCLMLDSNKKKPIGPLTFYNWFGPFLWILSLFDILSLIKWNPIHPKLK